MGRSLEEIERGVLYGAKQSSSSLESSEDVSPALEGKVTALPKREDGKEVENV